MTLAQLQALERNRVKRRQYIDPNKAGVLRMTGRSPQPPAKPIRSAADILQGVKALRELREGL